MIKRPDWFVSNSPFGDLLHLNCNVSLDFDLIKQVQKSMEEFNSYNLFQYPDSPHNSTFNTYKLLSDYYGIDIKRISIGVGSTELINRIVYWLKGEYWNVISPTFEMVEVFCDIHKVNYSLREYHEFNKFDISKIFPNSIVYVANPNGRNGHSFTNDEILSIIDKSKFTILDEAYVDFSKHKSLLPHLKDRDDFCILRTFSKSLGLAGLRFGYCFGSENFIKGIQSIRLTHPINSMVEHIVENFIEEIPNSVKRLKEGKEFIQGKYDYISSNGNYVLLKDCEDDFKNRCLYKKSDSIMRVSLTNEYVFKDILSD